MRAVFLVKDGTLVENVPYNVDPQQVRLSPGAGPALRHLRRHGFALFVVSNQPGVGLGRFTIAALAAVERRIAGLLAYHDVMVDGFYYCPHRPDDDCTCRKPAPGLLYTAAREQRLLLRDSWLVGDILDDIEAGARAGCKTVLLNNGNETEWQDSPVRRPDRVVADLDAAADHILASCSGEQAQHR